MLREISVDKPLAIPSSPAVSRACVASLGRCSSRTEAARVMGRSAAGSCSVSGGAEEGEGDDIEAEGEVEAICAFALGRVVRCGFSRMLRG